MAKIIKKEPVIHVKMKRKTRQLSEAEQIARKKYDGMTRREFNATKGKFAKQQPKARKGNFIVAALFYGNDTAQPHSFPVYEAALAHFDKLSINANISVLKLIEIVPVIDADGKQTNETKSKVLFQLNKTNQQFCNSKEEIIWRMKHGQQTEYRKKAIENSDTLMAAMANNNLEISRIVYYDGNPWWESARERRQ